MAESRWFNIPETGDGSVGNSYRPDYVGSKDVVGYSGRRIASNSPRFFVKVVAETSVLDSLASEPSVSELSGAPEQVFNSDFGVSNSASEYDSNFTVGSQ